MTANDSYFVDIVYAVYMTVYVYVCFGRLYSFYLQLAKFMEKSIFKPKNNHSILDSYIAVSYSIV